jgi:hypothetical protein
MPLDFLAAAIVEVFGFDFDHRYGFYSKLTGRVFASTPGIWCRASWMTLTP